MYLYLISDQYTLNETEYVGFVDSDSMFHSYVDRESVFKDSKAIVNGRIQKWKSIGTDKNKQDWSRTTYQLLGLKTPFTCMSYFPLLFKRTHITALQEFLTKRHKAKSFDEVFRDHVGETKGTFSQFDLICTYVWHNHRSEYDFHTSNTTPWYKGGDEPGYSQGYHSYEGHSEEMEKLAPRVAWHIGGRSFNSIKDRDDTIVNKAAFALCFNEKFAFANASFSIAGIPQGKELPYESAKILCMKGFNDNYSHNYNQSHYGQARHNSLTGAVHTHLHPYNKTIQVHKTTNLVTPSMACRVILEMENICSNMSTLKDCNRIEGCSTYYAAPFNFEEADYSASYANPSDQLEKALEVRYARSYNCRHSYILI